MYETRSQWDETHFDGESYFSKPEFSRSIKQNCTKVTLNFSPKNTKSLAIFTFNFFKKNEFVRYVEIWTVIISSLLRSEGGYPKF